MQIGAMNLLMARRSHMRKGAASYHWEVTTPDGVTHKTPELSEWVRVNRPELRAHFVAGKLGRSGEPMVEGMTARRVTFVAHRTCLQCAGIVPEDLPARTRYCSDICRAERETLRSAARTLAAKTEQP